MDRQPDKETIDASETDPRDRYQEPQPPSQQTQPMAQFDRLPPQIEREVLRRIPTQPRRNEQLVQQREAQLQIQSQQSFDNLNLQLESSPISEVYFCHFCNVEVSITSSANYTCPRCGGGCVEARHQTPVHQFNVSTDTHLNMPPGIDADPASSTTIMSNVEELQLYPGLPNDVARASFEALLNDLHHVNFHAIVEVANTFGGTVQLPDLHGLEHTLLELLELLTSIDWITETFYGPFNPMGDMPNFAWTDEGIADAITFMLNNSDDSGPPPLDSDEIAAIPNVAVTAKDIADNRQCAVCLESFEQHEPVKRLDCMHIFHAGCIEPWLVQHCTCPICRYSMLGDVENFSQADTDSDDDDGDVESPPMDVDLD